MTNKTLLNELEKAFDCTQQQYLNQDLEIRMTKETFEKMEAYKFSKSIEDTSYGMLNSYNGADVIIVPDTYFPKGVSPDTVLVSPKCNDPDVGFFEAGGIL